jgi:phage tail-like protein
MTGARGGLPTPLGNMRFRLEIEGLPGGGAAEVVFPEARIATARRGRGVHYGPLIIRRGLTQARDWYEWWDAARRGRRPPRRAVRVVLQDGAGGDAAAWLFRDALPVAYHLSPLHALGNEPVLETLELSIGDFEAAPGGTGANRPKARRRTAT